MQSFKDFFNAKIAETAFDDRGEGNFLKPKRLQPGVSVCDLEKDDAEHDAATDRAMDQQAAMDQFTQRLTQRQAGTQPQQNRNDPWEEHPDAIKHRKEQDRWDQILGVGPSAFSSSKPPLGKLPSPTTSSTPPASVSVQDPAGLQAVNKLRQQFKDLALNPQHVLAAVLPGISPEKATQMIRQYPGGDR